MSTVATIINRAMRLIGQVGAGETPTTVESADALVSLNALIDAWANDGLMCYANREEQVSMVASQASYTIGTGGDLNTTRPVEIVAGYVRENGYDHPMTPLSSQEYARIVAKTTESDWPTSYYYAPSMSTGTLYVYPVPNNATHKIRIVTRVPVSQFSATTDSVTLPPGWEEALATNLAISIAPEYETQASAAVVAAAGRALAAIKSINSRPVKSFRDLGLLLQRRSGHILWDDE